MQALPRDCWIDLVGKPFLVHGRGPDSYDCYGVVVEIARRRGIIVPDFQYGLDLECRRAMFDVHLPAWTSCDLEPGCALAFGTAGHVVHCGVAIDLNRFIHASEDIGSVVVSKLSDPMGRYQKRLVGAYRHVV